MSVIKNEEIQKIEKPWCTCGLYYASHFGKIIKETEEYVEIIFSESKPIDPVIWKNDPKFITRFESLEGAARNYQNDQNNHTDRRLSNPITELVLESNMNFSFPSYFKK